MAEGYAKWYLEHGDVLQGDEQTVDYYSDDEYEEDDPAVKHERKQITNLLHGYGQKMRDKLQAAVGNSETGATVGDPVVTRKGVTFNVQDVNDPVAVAHQARSFDGPVRPEFNHTNEPRYDGKTGGLKSSYVSNFTYDITVVIRDYLNSKYWKWNALFGLGFVVFGLVFIANALANFSAYMRESPFAVLFKAIVTALAAYLPYRMGHMLLAKFRLPDYFFYPIAAAIFFFDFALYYYHYYYY